MCGRTIKAFNKTSVFLDSRDRLSKAEKTEEKADILSR
jgi:hypothetical protein